MEIRVNGEVKQITAGTTVSDLLSQLELQPKYLAVERNLQLIPRTAHAACQLEPGDELEIVTLVGGG